MRLTFNHLPALVVFLVWSSGLNCCYGQDPVIINLVDDSGSGAEDSGSGLEDSNSNSKSSDSHSGESVKSSGVHDSFVHARVGQKVSLACPFLFGQNADIFWTRDYLSLSDSDRIRIRHARLTIRDVQMSDAGFYMCVVYDTDGIRSKTYNIVVHSKPVIISPLTDSQVTEGDSVRLPCLVDQHSTKGQLHQTWQRIDDLLPYGRFYLLPDGSLKIVDAKPSDTGTYECLVASRGGKARAAVKVNVLRRRGRARRDVATNCEGGFPHFASTFSYLIQNLGQSHRELANNTVFAPISLFKLLYMLYIGSEGATKDKFEVSLNFPVGIVKSVYKLWTECLLDDPMDPTQPFKTFNYLFFNDNFLINPNYTDWLEENENIEIHSAASLASEHEEINQVISNRTEGMISSLVSPDLLDPLSRMVLLSVLYFKDNWTYPFDPSRTKPGRFRSSQDNSYDVPMMHGNLIAKYARKDGFGECLELTYGGTPGDFNSGSTPISMFLHLPAIDLFGNELEGTATLSQPGIKLQSLYDFINREMSSFHDIPIEVQLPKFSLDSGSFSTEEAIKGLGLEELFEHPDFGGISEQPDLLVSDMLQRTVIRVDEQGTEAASATVVHVSARTGGQFRTPFYIDRPFSLILMHKPTMTPILAASITDLEKFAIQPTDDNEEAFNSTTTTTATKAINRNDSSENSSLPDDFPENSTITSTGDHAIVPLPVDGVSGGDAQGGNGATVAGGEQEGEDKSDGGITTTAKTKPKKHKPQLEKTADKL